MTTVRTCRGYSLIEVVFVAGLITTMTAISVPQMLAGIDEYRTAGAARYLSTRFHRARMEAVMRSASVAIQFTADGAAYAYAEYVDGNGNGVLTREIQNGVDPPLRPAERLPQQFNGVEFGTLANLPPIDAGGASPGGEPIRFGSANRASFSPHGTATAGTVYVLGRWGAQYAVRVFGETGKMRILRFDRRTSRWKPL